MYVSFSYFVRTKQLLYWRVSHHYTKPVIFFASIPFGSMDVLSKWYGAHLNLDRNIVASDTCTAVNYVHRQTDPLCTRDNLRHITKFWPFNFDSLPIYLTTIFSNLDFLYWESELLCCGNRQEIWCQFEVRRTKPFRGVHFKKQCPHFLFVDNNQQTRSCFMYINYSSYSYSNDKFFIVMLDGVFHRRCPT